MGLNVKHGGLSRYSAAVAAAETNAWSKGRLLTINTSGQIAISAGTASTATAGAVIGVALEDRVLSTSVGPTTTATVVGAPSGEKRSMILDFAVIETTELQSGVVFVPGDVLYCSVSGKVSTSGTATGSATLTKLIGIALSDGAAGDPARPLTMTFAPLQY
jgi:hypothetical protein